MVGYVAAGCQSDTREGTRESLRFYKFPRDKKAETALAYKKKTQKYPVDTVCQNESYLLLELKPQLEKEAISAGLY